MSHEKKNNVDFEIFLKNKKQKKHNSKILHISNIL